MQASSGPSGEALLAIAALAAIQLTAGKSDAQAAVLGAFFTMLGDAIGCSAIFSPCGHPPWGFPGPRGVRFKIPGGGRCGPPRRFL